MSALDVTTTNVRDLIVAGCRSVFGLASRFGVLSSSPTLRGVLTDLGVTVDADGWLHGDLICDQLTIDHKEQ